MYIALASVFVMDARWCCYSDCCITGCHGYYYRGLCYTSYQVIHYACICNIIMLAGVPGAFSRISHVFAHLLIGPSHMSCNNLERNVRQNKKSTCNIIMKLLK